MSIFIFMILSILGFKFFPKITGLILTIYAIVMIIASCCGFDWSWWPFC